MPKPAEKVLVHTVYDFDTRVSVFLVFISGGLPQAQMKQFQLHLLGLLTLAVRDPSCRMQMLLNPMVVQLMIMSVSARLNDSPRFDISKAAQFVGDARSNLGSVDFWAMKNLQQRLNSFIDLSSAWIEVIGHVDEDRPIFNGSAAVFQPDVIQISLKDYLEGWKGKLRKVQLWHNAVNELCIVYFNALAQESNEINIKLSQQAVKNNQISLQIAKQTVVDTISMRTLAIITLLFLPGAYFSALFSTPFFQSRLSGLRWLWLYLVTVLAFTIITFALWFIWQRREALNAVSWLHHHTSTKESKNPMSDPAGLSSLPTSRSLPPKAKINPALRNYGGLGPEVNVVFPPVFVPAASEVTPTNVPQKMKARFSGLGVVTEEEIKVKKNGNDYHGKGGEGIIATQRSWGTEKASAP